MPKLSFTAALIATLALAAPAVAQSQLPGAPDSTRVTAGRYQIDPDHTQVIWTVSHMGISPLTGAIGASGGTLEIDQNNLSASKVTVSFKIADMVTTSAGFTKHLLDADLFDVKDHQTATFTSTSVEASGNKAKIAGNLTIKGITKPVTLDAELFGAGTNPMTKNLEVGFSASAQIKRSEFNLGYGLPVIPDQVDLRISAAFSRAD